MSPRNTRTCKMEVNHREVSFPEGATVLRAAELNDIYIPSLCSHKDLTPFGGCRMCIVEIEGMRGYPLSCSAVAAEGMKVLTDTATLREMRKEIVQLILSEHPASCLICGEKDECRENQYTIRKAGVTTGCRYCPNDGQCELQDVVEKIGVSDIEYPVDYRGYEVEQGDPFFDRDYNLCILCGRCVRMCQEVRGTGVLAFKFRGPQVQIGPAFGKSHVEAGCEFCGACVSVCPTGTLADKVSKWDGKPDGVEVSTCPFCGIGCQVELYHKEGRLSRVHPNLDPEINDGQLCVRGRFCLPEMAHHHERAKKPMLRRGEYFREVAWEEAIDEVAGRLKGLKPADFLMVVSGDLTNESLYTAQKFVRTCLKLNSIDSSARASLPGGLGLWAKLFSLPISMKGIREADSIIAVGLDSRFYFSVAGVDVRRALRRGANLVTIDPRDSNLARYANYWIRPVPGGEGALLNAIAENLDKKKTGFSGITKRTGVDRGLLEEAVNALASGQNLAIVIGPTVFEYDGNDELVGALLKLAARKNTTFMPLYNGANTRGALELGAMGEILPGVARANRKGISLADVIEGRAQPKVIYLVGEVPFFERPACEYVIAQNTYYPGFAVDAFLPAASFAEAEGTLTNVEGRVQELVKIEDFPDGAVTGFTRPDWFVFSRLAEKLGCADCVYSDAGAVLREIGENISGFPRKPDRKPRRLAPKANLPIEKASRRLQPARTSARPEGRGSPRYLLVAEPAGFGHRGVDLSSKVEGLGQLALEEGFRLNPEDLRELRVEPGENIAVSIGQLTVTGPARSDMECPPGVIYFYRPVAYGGLAHRANLEPLYRLRASPLRVQVRAAKLAGKKRRAEGFSPRGSAQAEACGSLRVRAEETTYRILERRMIVPNVHELTVEAPEVAQAVQPGNFVIVRPDERGERMPLSVADWDRNAGTVTSIFMQVGGSTAKLARLKPGETIPTYAGPLGKETEIGNFAAVLCIAGCYGIGSLYPVARALQEAGSRVYSLLEARSSYLLYWREKFEGVCERVIALTRDGTAGYKGHISRLGEILTLQKIKPDLVIVNGCTFLLMKASKVTEPMGVKTIVNTNPIMIDGTGMCGVCRLTVGGKMKFACVDGPDFDGHEIDWEEFLKRRQTYNPEEVHPLRKSGCASHF